MRLDVKRREIFISATNGAGAFLPLAFIHIQAFGAEKTYCPHRQRGRRRQRLPPTGRSSELGGPD